MASEICDISCPFQQLINHSIRDRPIMLLIRSAWPQNIMPVRSAIDRKLVSSPDPFFLPVFFFLYVSRGSEHETNRKHVLLVTNPHLCLHHLSMLHPGRALLNVIGGTHPAHLCGGQQHIQCSLIPSHPSFFFACRKKKRFRFFTVSEKKLGRLGTRLHTVAVCMMKSCLYVM